MDQKIEFFIKNGKIEKNQKFQRVLEGMLLGMQIGVKKRQIFYQNLDCFKNQQDSDKIIQQVLFCLNLKRKNIGVFSSYKGLGFGNLRIEVNQNEFDFFSSVFQSQGAQICFLDYKILHCKIKYVLLIEKETIFFNLLQSRFCQQNPAFFILTAKGYGDYATKMFVIQLCQKQPDLIFLYLGDFDVYGFDIFLDYLFGSKNTVNENLSFQPLIHLGPSIQDVEMFQRGKQELSLNEFMKINKILS